MLFFNKPPAVIYIKKNSLDFYINRAEGHSEFPVGTVKDGDIANPAQYEKTVRDFLTANKLKKQKALFVLSEEIFYQKTVPFTDMKMLEEEFATFVQMVPIDEGNLRKKYVKIGESAHLFAVNKWLIERLLIILRKAGWEILAAVPLTLFSEENSINKETIKKIGSNSRLVKTADFLSGSEAIENTGGRRIYFWIIISLVFITSVAALLALRYSFFSSKPWWDGQNKATEKIGTQSARPGGSAAGGSAVPKSATQAAKLSKDELSVTVLNGTGIAGQAAQVRDLLAGLGFLKIETDNAQGSAGDNTIVIFTPKVSDQVRLEVTNLLEENFDSVSVEEDGDLQATDILITTGKTKTAD